MTPQPQSALELSGNFLTHPSAELVAEISHARLTGSLRVSDKDRKCILYFKQGVIAFAVSNARSSRLFDMMLTRKRLNRDDLAQIPNFTNDFEFAAFLQEKSFLTKAECDDLFIEQIKAIVIDVLSWIEGDWSFTSLARLRDGLAFHIDTSELLIDYGRCLPVQTVLGRFRSLDESFCRSEWDGTQLSLVQNELVILSKFSGNEIKARDLIADRTLPEPVTVKALYTLWLGGLLTRKDWNPAFSDISISSIRGAKLELRREAVRPGVTSEPVKPEAQTTAVVEPKTEEIKITVEEYLTRAEGAETYYDLLGIDHKADIAEIKRAYFSLAKVFHPDHFHKEEADLLRRVQVAFTQLAQAHETLKNEATREHYDFKVRKELAEKEKLKAAGTYDEMTLQIKQANESFERGFSLLMEGDHENAIQFLARAAHFAPKNSRYHAYYGKALASDEKQRHKAEAEMQAALRLDPNNQTFRIILAEFFIQQNLLRRAEGELTRLLAIFPSNREARELLDSLQK